LPKFDIPVYDQDNGRFVYFDQEGYDEWKEKSMNKREGSALGAGCLALGIAVPIILIFGVWFQYAVWNPWIEPKKAEATVQSAPYRMAKYEYFFGLCVSVQNAESAIDQFTMQLNAETDEGRKFIIQTNLNGAIATRTGGINTYNAEALKYETAERYRASNLPYQLDTTPYTAGNPGSPRTVCAVVQ
jgi:hypothetical protein